MARATTVEAARRRREVDELCCRGFDAWAISKALHCDYRTVERDLVALAASRRERVDVEGERLRLLEGARLVESTGWKLYTGAGSSDAIRLGALGKVLAAQQQLAAVLRDVASADVEARLAAIEADLAALTGGVPPVGQVTTNGAGHSPV